MKFHFFQNEITPAQWVSFRSIDQTPNWKYFVSLEMKYHVNTLLVENWKVKSYASDTP